MNLKPNYFFELSEKIINGYNPTIEELKIIAQTSEASVFHMLAGSNQIRETFSGNTIHLCTICNAKSGHCSENCNFCSQSSVSTADVITHGLLSKIDLQEHASRAVDSCVNRFSFVTSGKRLSRKEVQIVAESISEINKNKNKIGFCASLGILGKTELEIIANAGFTRYHHNLETAKSYFDNICSTHAFEERLETIKNAKEVGLSVCSGGIFGVGESDDQIIELALTLKQLDVGSIPINFLTAIQGTPLESQSPLSPLKCLKIISLFRYVLPDKEIIVCGGRMNNLRDLHPFIFFAGASGIMTGNYLTTQGRSLDNDLELLSLLSLEPRKNIV